MKNFQSFQRSLLAASLGLLGLAVSHASAQTVITSVPYKISAPGHYTLGGNLSVADVYAPAIKISASNVVLDLNGYYVAGPGDPAAANNFENCVIQVNNVSDVTIKNGTVSGHVLGIAFIGIDPANRRNFVVDRVTVTRCYIKGIYSYGAVSGSTIKRCSFSTIGNSTNASPVLPSAIYTFGGGFRIQRNNISGVKATGDKNSYGIQSDDGDFVIGNTVADCFIGITSSKCLNNLTYNVNIPFQSTINVTHND